MFQNWNSVVSDEDFVIVAGDFSAGVGSIENGVEKLKKISKGLKGNKYLIKGNHDHFSDDFYINELGFLGVMDYMILQNYFICHYPLYINQHTKEVSRILHLIEKFKESKCTEILCGHSHVNKLEFLSNHRNVCVDLNDFTPIFLFNQ
jgi:calcineurin-like phosphoesterase family protein